MSEGDVRVGTLLVALAALALGVYNAWLARRRDQPRVKVAVSVTVPTYGAELGPVMTTVTATNMGSVPVMVSSMTIAVTGGNSIPLMEEPPGSVVPKLLQPGDHTAMWVRQAALHHTLLEHRARVAEVRVSGPAGTWSVRRPKATRPLGGPGSWEH